jgi:D-glycero-beta-D-manno-heptose-7-phosphate kinase
VPEPTTLPTTERLLELVTGMAGQPVVMLVDLVADRFVLGTPKRISREAPVLILRYEGETMTPGGGANAVANIAALGGVPLALGVVGDDKSGDELIATLAALGVDVGGILVRAGYRTPTKTRVLAGGQHSIKQQIVRYDIEETLTLGEHERAHFRAKLAEWKGRARAAVASDYGYGAVEPALVPELRQALRSGAAGEGMVLADSRYQLPAFVGVDGATPNQEEAEAWWGGRFHDDLDAVTAAGSVLRQRLASRFLLVTRGSRGMALCAAAGAAHIPVHGTDQVADVTGAGDTVIGTFALALAAGGSPLEAAYLANYAGGIVVQKMGTATLSRAELAAAVGADRAPIQGTRWVPS